MKDEKVKEVLSKVLENIPKEKLKNAVYMKDGLFNAEKLEFGYFHIEGKDLLADEIFKLFKVIVSDKEKGSAFIDIKGKNTTIKFRISEE